MAAAGDQQMTDSGGGDDEDDLQMRLGSGCVFQKYLNSPFLPCLSFRIQSSDGDDGCELPPGITASDTMVCGTWAV